MDGPVSGTSIRDLQNNQMQIQNSQMQYNAMQNHQHEQAHNGAHHVQQAQHDPYYNIPQNNEYPRQTQTCPMQYPQVVPETGNSIEELAKEISDELQSENMMSEAPEQFETSTNTNGGYLSMIPQMLREPLIILVIFIVLSQPLVRKTIANYIPQINPINGAVTQMGIIIYGIILAVLYVFLKKVLML